MSRLGIEIIDRNEFDRLGRCLTSVVGSELSIAHVDSRWTDGSVEIAHATTGWLPVG